MMNTQIIQKNCDYSHQDELNNGSYDSVYDHIKEVLKKSLFIKIVST